MKSYVKPTGKYSSKRPDAAGAGPDANPAVGSTIHGKLVLLTLTFPRVRIIWSSSPYATADIFNDLKSNARKPDYRAAVAVGAEDTAKNVKYVMGKAGSVRGDEHRVHAPTESAPRAARH